MIVNEAPPPDAGGLPDAEGSTDGAVEGAIDADAAGLPDGAPDAAPDAAAEADAAGAYVQPGAAPDEQAA
ncbi:MAG TPA: hypothetical protein VNM34_15255, partial [Verrucomicrobiae bacterium]|nr:hypothetical protein [Verrucomicrobiae bacterium]